MKTYIGENTGAGGQAVTVHLITPVTPTTFRRTHYELPLEPSLKVYNHSPDGFQWGYGGSGPAQLALAILLDFTDDPQLAMLLHQDFKRDLIATAGTHLAITEPNILKWLNTKYREDLVAT